MGSVMVLSHAKHAHQTLIVPIIKFAKSHQELVLVVLPIKTVDQDNNVILQIINV